MNKRQVNELLPLILLTVVAVFLWACATDDSLSSNSADQADLEQMLRDVQSVLGNGNGAPSGAHYNLNIIGVPREKSADMTGDSGHRIFVKLEGNTKIMLAPGDSFAVVDANGTDGTARFLLPNPDPDNDGITEYAVFARALAKPGGSATATTCATDSLGIQYCSIYSTVLVRNKGKSSFSDVSRQLLYVFADLNGDGTVERVPLFDPALQDYFWSYDNSGLKLVQLRFYPVPSNVN